MSSHRVRCFNAVLEPLQSGLGWVIVRIPFEVERAWPVRKGLRVRGEISAANGKVGAKCKTEGSGKNSSETGDNQGFAFRTSLFGNTGGGGHFLLVNKKMQAAAKATVGSMVRIRLEPDLEERVAVIPPELAKALKGDRRLRRWFDGLTPYMRRMIGAQVGEAKSAESREMRAEKLAEWLLSAMEGETDPPPILKAAFLRQPLARAGWEAMTATQRRNHLLGIFHLQSAEGRERRAARAVEEALRIARKGIFDPE